MHKSNPVSLNLKRAPVVVGLSAIDSNAKLNISWPDKLDFAGLNLAKKDRAFVKDKLNWIKRQYEAMVRNESTRPYAPHVVPYLALADLNVTADKSVFSGSLETLRAYPLDYTQNLIKSLGVPTGPDSKDQAGGLEKNADGAAINDRARFRVVKRLPLNEVEIGFIKYYEESGLAYASAFSAWQELAYESKVKLLIAAVKAGGTEANYLLEAVLEPQLLLDSAQAGWLRVRALQPPTPIHSYALPSRLADGGMLERCFDISYELYSRLSLVAPKAAPLVCLWGHRQRALIELNTEGIKLMARPKKKRLSQVSAVLLDKLAELHPTIIEEVRATE